MTPEFEKWSDSYGKELRDKLPAGAYREESHFWLTAFVRLVREEAWLKYASDSEVTLGHVFKNLCQRFGLEGK